MPSSRTRGGPGSAAVMSAPERSRRVNPECRAYAEDTGEKADREDDQPENHDVVAFQHHAAWEMVLDAEDKRRAHAEADQSQRQCLLHDHADDGAIGRADE